MDIATTVSAVSTSINLAKEALSVAFNAKVSTEAKDQIRLVRDHLGAVQDKVFDLREQLKQLQEERDELRSQIKNTEEWEAKVSNYSLVETEGGAVVYASAQPPRHFACPSCFDRKSLQILQDTKTVSGNYQCTGCNKPFPVKPAKSVGGAVRLLRT